MTTKSISKTETTSNNAVSSNVSAGGDLNIESLQDASTYDSKQTTTSISATAPTAMNASDSDYSAT